MQLQTFAAKVLTQILRRRLDSTIASGPFRGMRYASASSNGVYRAELLGTYEKELHTIVESVLRHRFTTLVDIGSAEGYYAVGLALRAGPTARVTAFEVEPKGRELGAEMAELNGVVDRIRFWGRCEPAQLREAFPKGTTSAFVLCDVEGFEAVLLDPKAVPELTQCHILVELHEFAEPGVTGLLRSRFERTHQIEEIASVARGKLDCPPAAGWLRLLPESLVAAVLNEHRPGPMSWLWMQPRDAILPG